MVRISIIGSFLVLAGSVLAQEAETRRAEINETLRDLTVTDNISSEEGGKKALLTLIDKVYSQQNKLRENPKASIAKMKMLQSEHLSKLTQFIGSHNESRSSLSAILFLGEIVQGPDKTNYNASIDLLGKLRSKHRGTWQAEVAPIVQSRLIFDKGKEMSSKERLLSARSILMEALPEKQVDVDWQDPVARRFKKAFEGPLRNPLRAEYLLAIANCEYMLGLPGAAREDGADQQWLDKAEARYEHVIEEYSDTPHAQDARRQIEAIGSFLKK
jgi:hypothetical protein